jgi:quinoprotein glucose dehydrogenase
LSATLSAQSGAKGGEWRSWAGDLGATRYAPLDQIDADNFNTLEVAWRFKTDNLGPRPDFNLQASPLMINGRLYFTAGSRRAAVRSMPRPASCSGSTALEEGARADNASRRLSAAASATGPTARATTDLLRLDRIQLVGLDAKTGLPLEGFRRQRRRRPEKGQRPAARPRRERRRLERRAVVARNVVIVGASHRAGSAPRSKSNAKGYIAVTTPGPGKRQWIFHTIPVPGEFGNDTWLNDSWSYTGTLGSGRS